MQICNADAVEVRVSSTGTGSLALGDAVTGRRSFEDAGYSSDGLGFLYRLWAVGGADWETGLGRMDEGLVVRDRILASSSADWEPLDVTTDTEWRVAVVGSAFTTAIWQAGAEATAPPLAGEGGVAGGAAAVAGDYGVALGTGSVAELEAVALGPSARASGRGVAIGAEADNSDNHGIAIGRRARTRAAGGIAIGVESLAGIGSEDRGIAIGRGSYADAGIALGYKARAEYGATEAMSGAIGELPDYMPTYDEFDADGAYSLGLRWAAGARTWGAGSAAPAEAILLDATSSHFRLPPGTAVAVSSILIGQRADGATYSARVDFAARHDVSLDSVTVSVPTVTVINASAGVSVTVDIWAGEINTGAGDSLPFVVSSPGNEAWAWGTCHHAASVLAPL